MSKKKSRIKFAFITILAIIGIFLTCFSFRIPFTTTNFQGFFKSIPLGLDVKGGVLAVYEVSVEDESEFNTSYEQTISQFETILSNKGFAQSIITRQDDNRIRIEVPNTSTIDIKSVFDTLATDSEFKITKSGEETAIISGEHIKNASASFQNNEWGVALVFNNEGSKLFSNLTSESIGSSIDIWLDGSVIMSPSIEYAITYGSTFISGMTSEANAETYANKFLSSTFQGDLTLLSNQVVTPTLGINSGLYMLIAGIVCLVLAFIAMIVFYGVLGVLADFSIIFFTIIFAFFLQAVPLVELTLSGVFGIILSYVLLFSGHIVTFERVKDEYRSGKKIPASVEGGFKKSMVFNLDTNIIIALFSIMLYFVGATAIKSFGIVLFIGALLSLFTNIIMTKGFIRWYLPLNSTKAKTFNLKREAHVNEI